MSEEKTPVEMVDDNYSIRITLPEKRISSAISAEVHLEVNEEVGFNVLIYNVVQKPIDDKSPIAIPPGSYTLKLEASLLERPAGEVVEKEEVEVEALQDEEPVAEDNSLRALVEGGITQPSPAADRAAGRGKGRKTAAPRSSGGSPPKPRRARR